MVFISLLDDFNSKKIKVNIVFHLHQVDLRPSVVIQLIEIKMLVQDHI